MERSEFLADAFRRNIGLVTESQQERLLSSRVAVAGAGGVGGIHLLSLARHGVGAFTIADFDTFEAPNINRQFGAFVSTFGKGKAEVVAAMARDINPFCDVRVFPDGVTPENLDDFLSGADIYVDGIDFFEIDIRRLIFTRCREKGIPAVTSAPLGFGATLQLFTPGGMSFDDYFGITDGMSYQEKIAAFAVGLAPRPYHLSYLDRSKVSFEKRTGPALALACTLAASLVACETIKILTGIGALRPAPSYLQVDLLKGRYHQGTLRLGGRNPLQILKRKLILSSFRKSG